MFYIPLVWVGYNNNKTRQQDDCIDLSVEKASVSFLLQTEAVTLIFDLKLQFSLVYLKPILKTAWDEDGEYIFEIC